MARKLNFKEKILKKLKWHKKRTNLHAIIALLLCIVLIIPLAYILKPAESEAVKDDAVLTATMVGDIMFGRHVKEAIDEKGVDHPFKYVKSYFDQSDYVTGNFENPVLLGDEDSYPKADKSIRLSTTPKAVQALDDANFTVANLGNNHTFDYGEEGLNDTMQSFEKATTDFVGAGTNIEDAKNIHYKEVNGIKIATLGFNDFFENDSAARNDRGGVLPANPEHFIPMIASAKQQADLVFVHMHWGNEYDNEPHSRQEELARAISDAGADVIIGHHPHVLSTVEKYNDTVIFYSLGNFVFDQGWSRTRETALVQYQLQNDGTGQFKIVPAFIRDAQPRPLSNFSWYKSSKIKRQLTKNLDDNEWSEEGGNIILQVDHSDALKGDTAVGK